MLVFPRRNSEQSLTNFIRTINRRVKCGLPACLSCFPCGVSCFLVCFVFSGFLLLSFRFLLFLVVAFLFLFSWQLLGSTTAFSFFLAVLFPLMDHAQGRAFHHHLARAIMHLNHLAGLLPFFEPSIEWEDSMPPSHFHLDRSTSRGLHTFVPLPPSSLSHQQW